MFSGIVEATASIAQVETVTAGVLVRIWVDRPPQFADLKLGDSIAVNGVCLTVEKQQANLIQFAVAEETLSIVSPYRQGAIVNLERSLRVSERIHGHLVSGHVDATAAVAFVERKDSVINLHLKIPDEFCSMIWKKGSLAVNGVSLTVNEMTGGVVELCLIPETLARTNLGELRVGDRVNVEVDQLARAIVPIVQNVVDAAIRRAGVKL